MTVVRKDGERVFVAKDALEELVGAIFAAVGCAPTEALRVAKRLVGASLRGHDSHGVLRTPRYVQMVAEGSLRPGQSICVLHESGALAILDGNNGFGQTIGEQTVDHGVALAKRHGVGVTALRSSGHLGRIGDWAERAGDENCASVHMVNVRGSLLLAPFGGVERRGSTSPLCLGLPRPGKPTIIHDFATALVAEGKALVALRGGAPLPAGSLIMPDGTLTADPAPLYGEIPPGGVPRPGLGPAALTAFGMHKGSGLNFMIELFAGALTGSGTAGALGEEQRRPHANGMFSIYFDVAAFCQVDGQHGGDHDAEGDSQVDWLQREVQSYIEFWKSARPVDEGGEVLIPGEKEQAVMAERLVHGLPIANDAWRDLLATAKQVGVAETALADLTGDPK